MRKRTRRRKSKHKIIILITAVISALIIIISLTYRIEKAVIPLAQKQAKHFSKADANETIGRIISEYISEKGFGYEDFAAILYDENGRAASIGMLTMNVNRVQSELTLLINRELEQTSEKSVGIPIGSLSESYLLAGKGPKIRVKICPARAAEVRLTDSFSNAGVNQTCHRISAVVTVSIESSLPLYSFETESEFEFLIAENVIVGEVPKFASGVF